MILLRNVLLTLTWFFVLLAVVAAVLLQDTAMGVSGLAAASLAVLLGLVEYLLRRRPAEPDDVPYVQVRDGYVMPDWQRTDSPYRDPTPSEQVRPYWNTDVMGAPE